MASWFAWSMFPMFGSRGGRLLQSARVAANLIERPLTIPTIPLSHIGQIVRAGIFLTSRQRHRIPEPCETPE